jgi:hypothetical protein
MVGENGTVDVVRSAEELESVTVAEHLPERLRQPFPHGLPH